MKFFLKTVLIVCLLIAIPVVSCRWYEQRAISSIRAFCDEIKVDSDTKQWIHAAAYRGLMHSYEDDFSYFETYAHLAIPWGQAACSVTSVDGKVVKVEFEVFYD